MPIIEQSLYAGYTPLACTIKVEQTGPMELTFRAGLFVTIGQATTIPVPTEDDIMGVVNRILAEKYNMLNNSMGVEQQVEEIKALERKLVVMRTVREKALELVTQGHGEQVTGHAVLRRWHTEDDSQRSQTHKLHKDEKWKIVSHPDTDTLYRAYLGFTTVKRPKTVTDDEVLGSAGRYGGDIEILAQSHRPAAQHVWPDDPDGWTNIHWIVNHFVVPAGCQKLDDVPIKVFTVIPGEPPGAAPFSWGQQSGVSA